MPACCTAGPPQNSIVGMHTIQSGMLLLNHCNARLFNLLNVPQTPRTHKQKFFFVKRREHINKKFFKSITTLSSYLSGLLPPLRDSIITSRLRTLSLYLRPATCTIRYTTFIHHALLNCQ